MKKLELFILFRCTFLLLCLFSGCKVSPSKKSTKTTSKQVSSPDSSGINQGSAPNNITTGTNSNSQTPTTPQYPTTPTTPSTNQQNPTGTTQYQPGSTGTSDVPDAPYWVTHPTIVDNSSASEPKSPEEFIDMRESYILAKRSHMPILFIADNQFNNNLGRGSIIRTDFIDSIKRVAIRAPFLDKFSPRLFEYVLKKEAQKSKYIVHLGDVLNIACKSEFNQFVDIMKNTKPLGWVLAPGNHDMNYMGLMGGNPNFNKYWDNAWLKSCQNKNYDVDPAEPVRKNVMLKDNLVREYISALMEQNKTNPQDFPMTPENFHCTTDEHFKTCEFESNIPGSFLQRVYAVWPKNEVLFSISHRAWFLQEVNFKFKDSSGLYHRAIIADSTNYTNSPTFITGIIGNYVNKALYVLTGTEPIKTYNSGLNGEIRKDQLDKIDSWMNKKNSNSRWYFVTHHHWEELERDTQKRLQETKNYIKISYFYLLIHTTHFLKTKVRLHLLK